MLERNGGRCHFVIAVFVLEDVAHLVDLGLLIDLDGDVERRLNGGTRLNRFIPLAHGDLWTRNAMIFLLARGGYA